MSKPGKDLPAGRQGSKIQIPVDVLVKLLTSSEWRMLQNRYKISSLLEDGLSIRKIAERIKVGTDTVVRVARMIEIHPKAKKIKTQTPWIFGKSD